jgi:hypothetical protein
MILQVRQIFGVKSHTIVKLSTRLRELKLKGHAAAQGENQWVTIGGLFGLGGLWLGFGWALDAPCLSFSNLFGFHSFILVCCYLFSHTYPCAGSEDDPVAARVQ